jgi:Zn-dependent peptidase ImmA (M78 family)
MAPVKDYGIQGIGQRLRLAREGLGLSTRTTVMKLKSQGITISHGTLANYERGLTQPPENILHELSILYKQSLQWFRGEGYTLEGIRYRALKSVSVHEKNSFSQESASWLNTYLYLESLTDQPLLIRRTLPKIDRSISGKELAYKIREEYKFGNHPIPSTIRILEDFGIRVIHVHTDARIDAFAAHFGNVRVVVLNSELSADRMRMTSLHELAHHLYEDCLSGDSLSNDEIERRAFEFASHILIPSDILSEAFNYKSMVRLVECKEMYGISLAAMIYRGRKEHLITQRTYESIWKQFSKLGFRKNEPGNVMPDKPVRLESLIDTAITKRKVSYDDIAKQINKDEFVIKQRIVNAIGGTTSGTNRPSVPNVVDFQSYKDGHDLI